MSILDQAGQVRAGEQLDAEQVAAFVKQHLPDVEGPCTITQFPGGASNLTYLLSFSNRALILRRPPFGTKAKSAHDMGREFRVMSKLKPVYPYVPNMIAYSNDEQLLGCEFYIMEQLVGIIPRAELPAGLNLSRDQVRQLCLNMLDRLIELHSIDPQAAGLTDLGKGDGYVKRQIDGWSKRYRNARTDNVPDYETVMQWLADNLPEQRSVCIIHNDYRFDNIVLDPNQPTEVIGVLDWEMATLGDPLMELGNTLSYWVEAGDDEILQATRRQPTHLDGMLTRDEVVAYYCDKMGFANVDFRFYRVYGYFRLAAILQQIYYRYYHGQTQDKRFADFHILITHLERLCLPLIQ